MDWAALVISILALAASATAALYTRSQAIAAKEAARIAKDMLLHETEAHLKFRLRLRFTLPEDEQGDGDSTDTVWFLENNGKADALGVAVALEFDPTGMQYGGFFFDRVPAGSSVRLNPKSALPGLESLWIASKNRTYRADTTWATPAGERRSKSIGVVG